MKLGSIYSSPQASGSIGTTTASRNRYGLYIRSRVTPVNPASGRQSAVRNLMAYLTSYWDTGLTQAQRDAWKTYSDNVSMTDVFGNVIHPTALNHFIRSNIALRQAGLTQVDDAPTTFDLPEADPTFAVAAAESSDELTVTYNDERDWCDEAGGALLVSAGIPKNSTINFFNGPWRFTDSIDGDTETAPTSPATLTSPWALTAGQKQFYRARIVRADGRLSGFFRTSPATVS